MHSKYNLRASTTLAMDLAAMIANNRGAYTADHSLVDYILGITYEIWEEGGVDLINQYYAPQTVVYSLDGITRGAAAMIAGTNDMLAAFPDRLLLGDDVIGEGDSHGGYSSHRVLSPMTNTGGSIWGPVTNKQVRIMNMADCVVEDAVIVREWLARDNLALVRQLGYDVGEAARQVSSRQSAELRDWFAAETERLNNAGMKSSSDSVAGVDPQQVLHALWSTGDSDVIETAYPHYAVMHRSPVEVISGRPLISAHFERLRKAFQISGAAVDHVCRQPAGEGVDHVATRWSVCGTHTGDWFGVSPTGAPIFVMGVTHRRIVNGRIAVEWTVFDSLALLAQIIR